MTEFNINHLFISGKIDSTDDSLVRPSDWNAALVGTTGALGQHLVPNPTVASGISWQNIGFSYLTDEVGNILTDEAGNALEGKDTIDARLLVDDEPNYVEIDVNDSPYDVTTEDDFITVDASGGVVVINMLPLSVADKPLWIDKNEASVNTVDVTTTVAADKINGADVKQIASEEEGYSFTPFPSQYRAL